MSERVQRSNAGLPAAPPSSRPLAGFEHAMCLTEAETAFNLVIALRLAGDVAVERFRTALDALQRRHRLLRSRIIAKGRGFEFDFGSAEPIPFATGTRAAPDGWVREAEDELHRAFDLATGPLMRCRYLAGEDGGDLLVTLHHTIVDAESAGALLAELLTSVAGREPDSSSDLSAEGLHSVCSIMPEKYSGWRRLPVTLGFMGRQIADEARFRWGSRGVRTPPIADTGRCRLLPFRLSPELTRRVIEASRRHGVTLNAICSAALMAAVQRELYPGPRAPLRHVLFGDLRPRLRVSMPESVLGCFLSMFRITVTVERDGGFWPLASLIQQSTLRTGRNADRYIANAVSPGMMKALLRLRAFRMAATALSYVGATTLPERYGPFEINEVHAFSANLTLGPEYSALVRLFRRQLWWDILYLDSDMDGARAGEIAHTMEEMLERAAC